jgi:hypothetical protein
MTGHNGIGSRQVVARVEPANRLQGLRVAQLLRLRQVALAELADPRAALAAGNSADWCR